MDTHLTDIERRWLEPFLRRRRGKPIAAAMWRAPALDDARATPPPTRRSALLINPFYPKDPASSFAKHVLTPSLALTSVAAATPAGWSVRYWDENLLQGPPPSDPFPEVVGITVHLTFARRAYALADWYRARGARVVLGGLHVTSCPDEARPHADALALGEGTAIWPRVLRDAESGALACVYRAGHRAPFRDEPPPRRTLVPRDSFLTPTSVIATRGCHNRCGFCYLATDGLDLPYQTRDPEQVAAEIAADGGPYAVFLDNNLASKPGYLRSLCRALRPLDKIWSAAVSIDVTDEPALVREMALSGCTGVFVGFESLTDQNLVDARKRTPRADDYARRVRILHDHGIAVTASFVLGFDHDRPDVFDRTVAWLEENRLACATFHILTPYPGTPLFHRLEAEGRILHRDWDLYDTAHVVFQPRHLSPKQLFDGYASCYERVFAAGSIWRRRPEALDEALPYLAGSFLYKHANGAWHRLIRHRLTGVAWRPLVEASRLRHLRYRRQLEARVAGERADWPSAGTLVPSSV